MSPPRPAETSHPTTHGPRRAPWVLWVPPVGGVGTGMGRYSTQVGAAFASAAPEVEVVRPEQAPDGGGRAGAAVRWLTGREPVMSGWSRHAYAASVRAELAARGAPTMVVVDHLMTSWVVHEVPEETPVVYLAHNYESAVDPATFASGNRLSSAMRRRDAVRRTAEELRLVRQASLVVSITDADAERFSADGATSVVVWPPEVPVAPALDEAVEREPRALHLGSFEWRLKAENLAELVTAYAAYGDAVPLDVAGPGRADVVPAGAAVVTRLGTVDEHEKWALLATRSVGVVHEPRGGGFKLKILDYAVAATPVVWTRGSVTGFPLVDGCTGLEVGGADEVAPAVARLVASDELWRTCRDGMAKALVDFTADQHERAVAAVAALRSVCGLR